MNTEGIRRTRDEYYKAIKDAEDALKNLREICPHEHTSIGNYMWRMGSIMTGEICDDCGKFLRETDTTEGLQNKTT